ncbi:MAG: hypothetical protein NC203_07130 [Firmicutes bacterium]|nr:hypothetical protein [[Eubacterium] siraeum]MCM1488122.1 hypothetical protein [Bacillota bacterium]
MKKIFMALGLALFLAIGGLVTPVQAAEYEFPAVDDVQAADTARTVGLIKRYELSVSASTSGGVLYISGQTSSNSTMKEIGFKNIVVEHSSNGTDWYEEKNVGDLLKSNSSNYSLSKYAVTVTGGYYYRVTCTHYAKESGLFGQSQSESNTSNSVWVSKP